MTFDESLKHIKNAWIAACISGGFTLFICIISMATGKAIMGLDGLALLDVLLIFGLAFGIYRKSRVCAGLMLIYFVACKIWFMVETGSPNGLIMGAIFTYFYFMGFRGTLAYHREIKAEAEALPE